VLCPPAGQTVVAIPTDQHGFLKGGGIVYCPLVLQSHHRFGDQIFKACTMTKANPKTQLFQGKNPIKSTGYIRKSVLQPILQLISGIKQKKLMKSMCYKPRKIMVQNVFFVPFFPGGTLNSVL
jgi:hypothetical protein